MKSLKINVGDKLIAQNEWIIAGDMSLIVSNPLQRDIVINPGDVFEVTNIVNDCISLTKDNVQELIVKSGFLYLIDEMFEFKCL
jgi:hypothetical protein